jgi:hypothetical protein
MRPTLLRIGLIVCLCSTSAFAADREVVGRIMQISGGVQIVGLAGQSIRAESEQRIVAGDRIRLPEEASVALHLWPVTTVNIRGEAEILVESFHHGSASGRTQVSLRLLEGAVGVTIPSAPHPMHGHVLLRIADTDVLFQSGKSITTHDPIDGGTSVYQVTGRSVVMRRPSVRPEEDAGLQVSSWPSVELEDGQQVRVAAEGRLGRQEPIEIEAIASDSIRLLPDVWPWQSLSVSYRDFLKVREEGPRAAPAVSAPKTGLVQKRTIHKRRY